MTLWVPSRITEWDDGHDDARETKEALENARPIILAIGSLLVGLGLIVYIRSRTGFSSSS